MRCEARSSSAAPEYAAACSSRSRRFSRTAAMRASSSAMLSATSAMAQGVGAVHQHDVAYAVGGDCRLSRERGDQNQGADHQASSRWRCDEIAMLSPWTNASRSRFTMSGCVWHTPCGPPGYTLNVAFLTSFAESTPESANGTI